MRELVLQNIETGERHALDETDSGSIYSYGVWGDRVVWSTAGGFLKEYRISTGESRVVLEDRDLEAIRYVSVWEGYATFMSEHTRSPGGWMVYLVDLETDELRPLTPESGRADQPLIRNGRVVWTDFRAGRNVYVHSLRTGRDYVLNPSGVGSEPVMWDRTIVWQGLPSTDARSDLWVTRIGDI